MVASPGIVDNVDEQLFFLLVENNKEKHVPFYLPDARRADVASVKSLGENAVHEVK